MQYISTNIDNENLMNLIDLAQKEPIMIQQQDQNVAVILSPEEYERLRNVHIADFEQFCNRVGKQAEAKGLTEKKLKEILEG